MSRRFLLVRDDDVSGVSGTGIVAEGVEFDDGLTILHWLGKGPTTGIYDSVSRLVEIHGHDGRTRVVWEDKRHGVAA